MEQSDLQRLAQQFMRNAIGVKAGENVWIEHVGPKALPLATACAVKVKALGGQPHLVDSGSDFINKTIGPLGLDGINAHGEGQLQAMKAMQAYIRVKDDADQQKITLSDEQKALYSKAMRPMINYRVKNTRWLVTAAPTEEFAQACGMDFDKFKEFYLKVCLLNYNQMGEAVKPLEKILTEGDKVRIYSPQQETDLTFSIRGIPAVPCTGSCNIPDGECFTAPVRDSINGTIKFGPSNYQGERFSWIKLKFSAGKVIEAVSENAERTAKLNKILDTDEGARYTGEFAINFNPHILHPTGSILFDEKIAGGIHLTPGQCYDEAYNGNTSAVHWDMVHIQRPDYGGGELWIDDVLIRKDGIFTLPELQALNPDNLMTAGGASSPAP